jgi:hypothetical protein
MHYFPIPDSFPIINCLNGEPADGVDGKPRMMSFAELFRLLLTDPDLCKVVDTFDRNDLRRKGTRSPVGTVVEFTDKEHEAVLKAMKNGQALNEHIIESASDVFLAWSKAPTKKQEEEKRDEKVENGQPSAAAS